MAIATELIEVCRRVAPASLGDGGLLFLCLVLLPFKNSQRASSIQERARMPAGKSKAGKRVTSISYGCQILILVFENAFHNTQLCAIAFKQDVAPTYCM